MSKSVSQTADNSMEKLKSFHFIKFKFCFVSIQVILCCNTQRINKLDHIPIQLTLAGN